ncbi:TonB-dependent receptor [uncultured Roseibium sp.]|uniref:TonB-dependent receptor n=1 Tax=uncultured Roseibium sp. TaxID=1936171 RepID=UPI003216F255
MAGKLKLALAGTAGLAGSIATAFAQDTGDFAVLDTITVSSGKRDQTEERVDGAITVITGEELVERGVKTVDDLQTLVPGLTIDPRGNRIYSNVTMRGLSSPDFFNPTVQIYIDGVPQQASAFSRLIADVDRIEVLRGPQGTLYGANAFAGVINVYTRTPEKNRFYMETSLSPQEPGVRAGGTVALVPDKLFLDFAGAYSYFAGDIDEKISGDENINTADNALGRFALRYQPAGGDFDATLQYSHEYLKSHEELYLLEQDLDDRIYDTSVRGDLPFLQRNIDSVSFNWNRRFGAFTLSGTSAYQETDVERDFSAGPGTRYIWPQKDKTFSQELRLGYDGVMFNGVAGLWYLHDDFKGEKNGYPGYYGDSVNEVKGDSLAGFGEVTWHATDRLDLTAGMRVTYDRSSIDAAREDSYSTGYGFAFANEADYRGFQPKVAIGFALTDTFRLYGVVSKGYKPGGFNHSISSTIDATPYDPETAWNYEVGAKASLLDGALDLRLASYYVASTDKQIYVGPAGQQFIRNAGKAESYGLELEAAWRATDALSLTGNLAVGRSQFTDYTDPYTSVSYDGNLVPFAPDVTARIAGSYILSDDFLGGTLTANGAASYISETYFDEANVASQPAYALFDASLELGIPEDLTVRLYVDNIADTEYKTYGYAYGGTEFGNLGQGRTFGLTLRKVF